MELKLGGQQAKKQKVEDKRIDPDIKRLFPEPSDVILLKGKTPIPTWDPKSLNPIFQGFRAMILGTSGTGKSNLMCNIMKELADLIDIWCVVNSSESASLKYTPFMPSPAGNSYMIFSHFSCN
jgi:hypothetical protein